MALAILDSSSAGHWALLLLAAVAGSFLLARVGGRYGKKKYNLPPGPAGWPYLGNLITLFAARNLPHRALVDLAKTHGPVMLLQLGTVRAIYVSDAAIARQAFKDHDRALSSRPNKVAAFKYLTYGPLHIAMAPYGPYWQLMKKILVLELLTAKRIQQFKYIRDEEQQRLFERVSEAAKGKTAINMHETLGNYSLAAVSRLAMGRSILENDLSESDLDAANKPELGWLDTVNRMLVLFGGVAVEDFLPALGWLDVLSGLRGEMKRLFRSIDLHLQHMVNQHKDRLKDVKDRGEETEARDLVDVLLMSAEKPPGDACVKALVLEAVTAGAESTAVALEWALSELVANQDFLRRAQEEVDAVVGRDRRAEESDTANLPFLQAVIKESMRLHVPFPVLVPRDVTEDCKVGGYDVPAGSMLVFQAWGIARDGELWEDPETFNPDRFQGSPIDIKGQHMEVMPFGSGRRQCPGMNLALTVIHVTLARLVHGFDWRLPDGVQKLDMMERYSFSAPRRSALVAVPTPRLPHVYG